MEFDETNYARKGFFPDVLLCLANEPCRRQNQGFLQSSLSASASCNACTPEIVLLVISVRIGRKFGLCNSLL